MPQRFRAIRRAAVLVGSLELPLSLLWCILGAGIYGSPLSGVSREGLAMVLLLLVLAGPLSLLPLAFIARSWPRTAGAGMLAGGLCAAIVTLHPFGLRFVAFNLWNEIWPVVALISLVPMVFGVLLVRAQPMDMRSSLITAGLVGVVGSAAVLAGTRYWEASLRFRTLHPVTFLAFAADGDHLLAAHESGLLVSGATVSLIDPRTGVATPIADRTNRHLITPDRTKLIIAHGEELQTDLWDVATRQTSNLGKFSGPMAVSATGLLALTLPRGVQFVDTATSQQLGTLKFEAATQWLAFSPDGRTLAVGGYRQVDGRSTQGSDIALWDVRSSTVLRIAGRPDEEALRAQFTPDGSILAILAGHQSNRDGGRLFLRLWSMRERRELPPLDEAPAFGASAWFTPDGQTFITVRADPGVANGRSTLTASLWNTATWRRKATMPAGGASAWSPDSKTLAIVELGRDERGSVVGLWSTADGRRVRELGVVDFPPEAIAFAPDGRAVAVGGTIKDQQIGNRPGRVAVLPLDR